MSLTSAIALPKGLSITFLGHASFRVVTEGGKTVLFDPWLTGNPVLPESEREQNQADLILITHGHMDHLDPRIEDLAERTGASIAAHPEVLSYLATKGVTNVQFINKGGTVQVGDLGVTMTHALHPASIQLEDGSRAHFHEAAGMILTTETGFRIYHAGDTAIFSDMSLIGEIYHPDLALLPIGDRATMGPLEASYAVRLLGVSQVVPIHYKTFPMLTGTVEAFAEELAKRGLDDVKVAAMEPGDTITA